MQKELDWAFLWKNIIAISAKIPVTMYLALLATFFGVIIGLLIAIIRIYKIPALRWAASAYVSFIRGTPVLVQLYLVYYGVPWVLLTAAAKLGMAGVTERFNPNNISPVIFALVTFSLNSGGYLSETLRSAIESVDRGQIEAARSIGLRESRILLKIVLPQAALNAIPNLGNSLIGMVKDTSLAFSVMVIDVMGEAKLIGSKTLRYLEIYIAVSIVYWSLCILLELIFGVAEKRMKMTRRELAE
ncbi:MAG: amino acid ABC transporter permease [Synergistaceae bacterium]|nr:amino acid ABC transporter permease [Synergistaceae bacterium]